jgi:hypothetical protein
MHICENINTTTPPTNDMDGYDYTNPKRFFTEPLMRYILMPIALLVLHLIPFVIVAIIHNDGGRYLLETFPFLEYYLPISLFGGFCLMILYTVLYYVRGWHDKKKWGMSE